MIVPAQQMIKVHTKPTTLVGSGVDLVFDNILPGFYIFRIILLVRNTVQASDFFDIDINDFSVELTYAQTRSTFTSPTSAAVSVELAAGDIQTPSIGGTEMPTGVFTPLILEFFNYSNPDVPRSIVTFSGRVRDLATDVGIVGSGMYSILGTDPITKIAFNKSAVTQPIIGQKAAYYVLPI